MDVTEKLLKHIHEKHGTDPAAVSKAIGEYQGICRDLHAVGGQIRRLKEKYDEDLDRLKKKKAKIEKQCDHPDVSFHGDPSGGSDSHEECNVCGAWARRLKRG